MTTIDPDDIRVGDTVQRTCVEDPIVVSGVSEGTIWDGSRQTFKRTLDPERATYTWELIERPEGKPADGSKWKPGPEGNVANRWIYNAATDSYILWRRDPLCSWNIGKTLPATSFATWPMIPDDES